MSIFIVQPDLNFIHLRLCSLVKILQVWPWTTTVDWDVRQWQRCSRVPSVPSVPRVSATFTPPRYRGEIFLSLYLYCFWLLPDLHASNNIKWNQICRSWKFKSCTNKIGVGQNWLCCVQACKCAEANCWRSLQKNATLTRTGAFFLQVFY